MSYKQQLNQRKAQNNLTNDTAELIDFLKRSDSDDFNQQIDQITTSILNAKQTIFIGSGNSGVMAKYGARFFSSIGELSLYIDDPHYPIEGNLYSDSVVIICSVSGESRDIITHINNFKAKNCQIISITNNQSSTISKMSHLNISTTFRNTEMINMISPLKSPSFQSLKKSVKNYTNKKFDWTWSKKDKKKSK